MTGVSTSPRVAILAGATGLVGSEILAGLVADPTVAAIHVLARRRPDHIPDKVQWHVVHFGNLPTLPPVTEVYLALGTTIRQAGSQAAFRAVDYDANLAVAQAALAAGARTCGLVSSMSANANSRLFYSRVKGELEVALAALPFAGLVVARPSLLVGNRSDLGQPERPMEAVGLAAAKLLQPIIPKQYQAIDAAKVARALLARVPSAQGHRLMLSAEMQSA